MQWSGFCAPALLGAICRRSLETGKTRIVDFADGATREFGNACSQGYDSQAFVDSLEANGIEAVIPPRKNRKRQRIYLYRLRHMVENAMQQLKEWRGVATRYAKRASSFLAIVQIRCAF